MASEEVSEEAIEMKVLLVRSFPMPRAEKRLESEVAKANLEVNSEVATEVATEEAVVDTEAVREEMKDILVLRALPDTLKVTTLADVVKEEMKLPVALLEEICDSLNHKLEEFGLFFVLYFSKFPSKLS